MVVDRSFWIDDLDYYNHLISKSRYSLVYDDSLFVRYFESSKLSKCHFCGGRLKRSIVSTCAGHGEFPRSIRYRCFNCVIDVTFSCDYGNTFEMADANYLDYCHSLKDALLS